MWRVRVGGYQSQSCWAAHTPAPAFIHSFIHSPCHPRPGRHLGSHGGDPAPEFQEGKERLHQGEQTPRGAPEANSMTPSTAGTQYNAPPLTPAPDSGDPPADPGGDWARGCGPRCVPSGFVSNDPLSLRVARMSPLRPGSIQRGPPLGHSGLGACVSALGTLAWPRDLGTSAAFSLCSRPSPADGPVSTHPGPAENSGDAIKVPGICSWLGGPGPLLPDGQGSSPPWPPGSVVTSCARQGRPAGTGRGPEVGFPPQAGRTLELPPRDPRSQPGACAWAPLQV